MDMSTTQTSHLSPSIRHFVQDHAVDGTVSVDETALRFESRHNGRTVIVFLRNGHLFDRGYTARGDQFLQSSPYRSLRSLTTSVVG